MLIRRERKGHNILKGKKIHEEDVVIFSIYESIANSMIKFINETIL